MLENMFIVVLAAVFSLIYGIAFRVLPGERWQVFASVPLRKNEDGSWTGVNLTYYGLLTSTGYAFAIAVLSVMLAAAGAGPLFIILLVLCLMVLFVPSARLMALIIERKRHTLTVGGAVFVLFLSAPWVIAGLDLFPYLSGHGAAGIVCLASLVTSYAFGEGIGRLACISFGCCYGKPLSSLPPVLQRVFSGFNFIYTGKTKKISYHDQMDGVKTVPVQAITAVLYTASGLAGLWLFINGQYYSSFFLTLTITQVWRFASEFLRSDFRGYGRISAYQKMSLFLLPYYALYVLFTGISAYPVPELVTGFRFIWDPGFMILLFVMWFGCLFYTGVSSVTSSTLYIYVNEDKI